MNDQKDREEMKKIGQQLGLFRGASTSEIFKATLNRARLASNQPPVERPATARLFIMSSPKNDN